MSRLKTERPVMLLILGVHRSGTSMVARMLECLRAAPSKNLLGPLPNNPKGFFEDFDVQRFNEYELLPALGAHWQDLAPLDWKRLSAESRSSLLEKAVGIVGRNFSRGNAFSILKDPRIGILLPFWLEVLENTGFEVRAVCTVRDPLSVARSLQARDGFSITHGAMLYASNWLTTFPHLKKIPNAFLAFDAVFQDARSVLERVAGQLGIPLPQDFGERVREFVSNHLDPALRQSVVSAEELKGHPKIPQLALSVHRALQDAVETKESCKAVVDFPAFVAGLADAVPLLRDYDRLFLDHADLLQTAINHENEIAALQDEAAEQEGTLSRFQALIQQRNREAIELDAAIHSLEKKFKQIVQAWPRGISTCTMQTAGPRKRSTLWRMPNPETMAWSTGSLGLNPNLPKAAPKTRKAKPRWTPCGLFWMRRGRAPLGGSPHRSVGSSIRSERVRSEFPRPCRKFGKVVSSTRYSTS